MRRDADPKIMLDLLASIERDSRVTQRRLAGELGIALGLANSYLNRCVRKGLVKMSQVPLNRYAYYLTPQGFAEKSRLTAEYLTASFDFFRRARADCAELLAVCAAAGWQRAALCGAGELAEIAILSAREGWLEIVCVIDSQSAGRRCGGLAIVTDITAARMLAQPKPLDGLILTDTHAPQARFDELRAAAGSGGFEENQVVAPRLLGISPSPTNTGAAA